MNQLELIKKVRSIKDKLNLYKIEKEHTEERLDDIMDAITDLEEYIMRPPETLNEALEQVDKEWTITEVAKNRNLQALNNILRHIR